MRKMSKITGLEAPNQVPPKVTAMYRAVSTLLREDKDISEMSVSMITGLAGIGKGTAYEYFDSKEEIIVCALLYEIRTVTEQASHQIQTWSGSGDPDPQNAFAGGRTFPVCGCHHGVSASADGSFQGGKSSAATDSGTEGKRAGGSFGPPDHRQCTGERRTAGGHSAVLYYQRAVSSDDFLSDVPVPPYR